MAARARVQEAYSNAVAGDTEQLSPTEALSALLSKSSLYSENSTVLPYAKDKVSWPDIGAQPVPIGRCALPGDVARLDSGCESLLRPLDEVTSLRSELGLRQVYSDPTLINNPKLYADF